MEKLNVGFKAYRISVCCCLAFTFFVISYGAYTRLTESGLGCPDWPGCFGSIWVHSQDLIQKNNLNDMAFNEARIEMYHRYYAAFLGFLILILIVWNQFCKYHSLKLTYLLGITLILQAFLGKLTVTMLLKPVIIVSHFFGALCICICLVFILRALNLNKTNFTAFLKEKKITYFTSYLFLFLIALQMTLGVWVSSNYASMVCSTFPICEHPWLSMYDLNAFNPLTTSANQSYQFGVLNLDQRVTLHITHRFGAMILTVMMILYVFQIFNLGYRKFALLVIFIFILQLLLGINNILSFLNILNATLHNLVGVLLFVIVLYVHLKLRERCHENYI